MKIYTETDLSSFEFWAGAKDNAEHLTTLELDSIQEQLEDIYPDGMSETELNDLFWFDEDFIAECLGYTCFEDILTRDGKDGTQ